MKDPVHHRKTVQKEVLRSTRRDAALGGSSSSNSESTAVIETSSSNIDERVNHDHRQDHDGKRKIPLQYVRHTTGERMH